MDCSPDIDWAELIRITDGYSGADLANVCRDAAMMPLRKKIASGGINIAQISQMQQDFEVALTMEDFKDAIRNISKSVSKDQLDEYATWMKQFGSV
jgi:katanin p60 ATPase-containing subunit A1